MQRTMERIGEAPPLELCEFKNLGPNTPTTCIPEIPENRVPTDRPFIYIFGGCVLLLMPLLIYTLVYSDVQRLFPNCIEICKKENGRNFNEEGMPCDEVCAELTRDGALKEVLKDKAVKSSEALRWITLYNINLWLYLTKGSVILRLVFCSMMGAGVSILALYVFRYAVGCVVWTMIAGFFALGFVMVVLMWTFTTDTTLGIIMSVIATILLPLFGFIVYRGRERISLVIVIMTEAAKAVFAMRSLIIDPLLMWLFETSIITLLLTTTLIISTAGEEVENMEGEKEYVMSGTMNFTMFFNFIMGMWGLLLVNGLENMIVAGAVSEWYFTPDKFNLGQPVRRSAITAYKFHLGTVAFGSLVILLTAVFRYLIKSLERNRTLKYCINHYMTMVQHILDYLTNNAYIVTAMHGQPFFKSGKRAASLVVHNFGKAVAIRTIGRLTLGVGKTLIGFITVILSVPLFLSDSAQVDTAPLYALIFLEACYVGATFLAVLEISMDTIFICFCEDLELNDGLARPYAMSNDLLEFIHNLKRAYGVDQEADEFEAQKPQIV